MLKDCPVYMEEKRLNKPRRESLLLMMEKGEIPAAEKPQLFSTYFTGLFRSMRFGTESAAAPQCSENDEEDGRRAASADESNRLYEKAVWSAIGGVSDAEVSA